MKSIQTFSLCFVLILSFYGVLAHDHRRGEGEAEGERHRHHHHHAHGEGDGETGHDHSDHGGKSGPWYCESYHRFLKVEQNTVIIGKKRSGQSDVIAQFTLDSIVEKNAAGNQVIGSGLVGVQHTHSFNYTSCSEDSGCVMHGDLDRNHWYQGLPVCRIMVTYVLSKTYDVKTTIDFYFFKGEGVIRDGPKHNRAFYEVTRGTVLMDIQHHMWKWCTVDKQNCVIKQKHTKTYDVGAYLDFDILTATPTSGIQCPDDDTLWYLGSGAYAYFPHFVQTDEGSHWALQLDGRPVFDYPTLTARLPYFDHQLSWGLLITFAEPLSGWRPGGPSIPPTPPSNTPFSSSSSSASSPPPPVSFSSSAAPSSSFSSSAAVVVTPPSVSSSSSSSSPASSAVTIVQSSTGVTTPVDIGDVSSSTGASVGPPSPPAPPCVGSLCNSMDSSSGGTGSGGDPVDDPGFNPWPTTGSSSSTGGVGGADTSTGGSGSVGTTTGGVGPQQPATQDCMVTEWSEWMPCDALCGMGSQTRTRNIMQMPANGGSVCPTIFQIRDCDPEPPMCAPADCVVGPWTYWTVCSGPCGLQNRTRDITTPPQMGGLPCPSLFDSRLCRQLECLMDDGQTASSTAVSSEDVSSQLSAIEFSTTSGNAWWIALCVLAWIGIVLGINEYITRLWDRPSPVAEADPLVAS